MRAAGKSLSLISTPLSLLRPSASVLRLSSASLSSHLRRSRRSFAPLRHLSTVRTSNQTASTSSEASLHAQSLPVWAEWAQLVEFLTHKGYFDRAASYVSELRENGDLTKEFVRVSEALILFANENPELIRSLSKKDIALVVENVSPHLFKNGENSALRLKSFLNSNINNGCQAEVAETMDLIPYILSYTCDNNNNNNNNNNNIANLVIDESIKSLLVHLVNSTKTKQRHSPVQNIINNVRPKIVLTGKEWDCPECNFFNHGRNISCLRCDLKRPGKITKTPSKLEDILNKSKISDNGSNPNKDFEINQTLDNIFNRSNSSKLNNEPNWESLATVKDPNPNPRQNYGSRPNKDLNQQETNNDDDDDNNNNNNDNNWESLATLMGETGHVPFRPLPANIFGKKKKPNSTDLDATKEEKRFITRKKKDGYNRRIDFEQANNDNNNIINNNGNNNSGFVPFVPLPPDYFAKKRENKTSHSENSYSNNRDEGSYSKDSYSDKSDEGSYSQNSYTNNSDKNDGYSENSYSYKSDGDPCIENSYSNNKPEGSYSENSYSNNNEVDSYSKNNYSNNNKNSYPENSYSKLDMSEEAKTERWFKRAAQINDISELANIPDEDFPEIMPMRKGVNRFVVSKRKTPLERRLSETKYRRHGRERGYLSDS